ncbi:hypothetical protein TRP8649_03953 [Pelagimonas phthalicica]|uniref:Uncharacterized protein n=1 Tax=Pelagimonas phthalicica TaxID=1037362 RepID=A0A238JHY3_9RHOB|nr:hypothetical protein [Pelagimonas phthalicica]TDS89646.1 hypothetical protein CLV87_3697 [Pelagimonas phthalicica]SMX29814.1 hypothetical protein TRP8649_03953 [Pelagimonas phthalicica]
MFFGPIVDEDTQDWVLENFEWAIATGLMTKDTRLVSPTAENFPVSKGEPAFVARGLVDAIAGHLGIESGIEVRALDVIPAEYRIDYNATGDTAGTWQSDGNGAVISFDPSLAQRPMSFLSTLVHEMMHQRLHMTEMDFPGGLQAEELATDLHAITSGFGEVQMMGAEQAGWQGYMRQETRAFALSVFLDLTGEIAEHVPSRSAKLLRKTKKLLRNHEDILNVMRLQLGHLERV